MPNHAHAIILASRPETIASVDNFAAVDLPIPSLAEGEVLTRTLWLSLDPYMRGRMVDAPSYAAPVGVGEPMTGETIGEVIESRDSTIKVGQIVLGARGWATHLASPASQLTVLQPGAPWQAYLGVLGMPGATAFAGLRDIGRPKAGETIVVSAASGAVGSVVVQLAREAGARVVGIAGGADKCNWVRDVLGADACIDYRAEADLAAALQAACPSGVDVYWENVGGDIQKAVFPLLNDFGRMVMCGMIAEYDGHTAPGPNLMAAVTKRLLIQGLIVLDRAANFPEWRALGARLIAEGKLHYREQIVECLDQAPAALIDLFNARNDAKIVVRVGEPSLA
ncbi:NADP-dependent oxidoreductase [Sphingobium sp. BHU LFT2]|uniref:NADP-dependent oxidoreductase n=1 Tax=Sphingobium sp. BHU LFT2 TaxID=2807634 RepID=UPI001BE537FA|nr:NADP-dependent oxidoreductase [Sphingobium sp. BHU LFT2]MBT2246281.1 NADP-dependent oxidoreductase [Sphingobium sp. BHU LFT2]